MRISRASFEHRSVSRGRTWGVWRLGLAFAVSTFALTGWVAASASAATTIHVNTTRETGVIAANGFPTGDNSTSTECSLRGAIRAANSHTAVGACPAGTGNDTIVLPAGVYHIGTTLPIGEKMTIEGPNHGKAGNDPSRGAEAILSLDALPGGALAGHQALFWLNADSNGFPVQPPAGAGAAGAGAVFDGVVMQGGFVPVCGAFCQVIGVVQPSRDVQQPGYTVTNSIVRNFSMGLYLGGTDTITHNLFEDNVLPNAAIANGNDVYGDPTYISIDSVISHNVFKNPATKAITLEGDAQTRTRISGTTVEDNLIFKENDRGYGVFVVNSTNTTIRNNAFLAHNRGACGTQGAAAIHLDKVTNADITGNTITGWSAGLSIGDLSTEGAPGSPGSTGVSFNFNRIYNNCIGIRVSPTSCFPPNGQYAPLGVDANDNWWGANGGPGSDGARPGASNPVNGVQFVECNATTTVPNQGGVTVDRWLHLTCTAPATLQTNVPADVAGHVEGMPVVDSTATTGPWFIDEDQPLMDGSSNLGAVYGFGRVPNENPKATLTGTLIATHTGSGEFLVALDSEQVACHVTATPGPEAGIDKHADTPTVAAGGLEGYTITVTNRGRRTARNWWVCDLLPRGMSFVSATRRMRRYGASHCLVIGRLGRNQRVSFHMTTRVARNAPVSETNVEEVIPGPPTGGDPTVPAGPPAVGRPPHPRPIATDAATVRVRRGARFTG